MSPSCPLAIILSPLVLCNCDIRTSYEAQNGFLSSSGDVSITGPNSKVGTYGIAEETKQVQTQNLEGKVQPWENKVTAQV